MKYYVNLFSPETYEASTRSGRDVSGFQTRQKNAASTIEVGDRFICYMTKLSRWIGVLEVTSKRYEDDTPIFYPEDDPFVVRFDVKRIAWLDKEKAVPIHDDRVWNTLSFTRAQDKGSSTWTGMVRGSLRQLEDRDGRFLEQLIRSQAENGEVYPIDEKQYQKLVTHRVRALEKTVTVSVPEEVEEPEETADQEVRESVRVQALLAQIGAKMGLRIWIPARDRSAVLREWEDEGGALLEVLPLSYDVATLKTIEQIDVIWLRGRSILRAFEVEHTTSI